MTDRVKASGWAGSWRGATTALAALLALGCAGLSGPSTPKVDQISRSGETFFRFLQSPGKSIAEIRELVPGAKTDSIYLVDENVTNEELGDYIQREASEYPFEIFLRVTVSKIDQHVYRYIVKGDWRSVKMGYGSLAQPELYDAIYLHTHPRDKRVIPNSIPDYIHAETFRNVSTLLVGSGIPIEFESIPRREDKIDTFDVDGRKFSRTRVEPKRPRTAEQARRSHGDADDDARALDRIFTENVEAGHERVVLQNSEGMRVVYERSRPVDQRLNEVYRNAGLDLPSGTDGAASRGEITQAPPSESPRPLGF